ncbi:hypothetical protein DIPPA_25740 [Diplonema papillatum]|nr:hypothetical protein DIPPA_25740 [Diplonema papillatum]
MEQPGPILKVRLLRSGAGARLPREKEAAAKRVLRIRFKGDPAAAAQRELYDRVSAACAAASRAPTVSSSDPDALCVACFECEPELQLLPCNHAPLCNKCLHQGLRTQKDEALCPLCRAPVESTRVKERSA